MLPVIIIPALDPDQRLVELVTDLLRTYGHTFQHLVVVNDGSKQIEAFQELTGFDAVTLLEHDENRGKGAALKTAMKWILGQSITAVGAVTADADGQHRPHDIARVAQQLCQKPDTLWLGGRCFDGNHVPLRSRIGNRFSRFMFRFGLGVDVEDTQTGLRGIPFAVLPALLESDSDHYEFELDMLMFTKRMQFPIDSISIETVYENNNEVSHFRPLIDSMMIYRKFIKFSGVSIISAFIDYGVFALIYAFSGEILAAIAGARVLSGVFNFTANRQWVFQRGGQLRWDAAKYTSLAIALVLLNYAFTKGLLLVGVTPFIGKPLSEFAVFLISYKLQKKLIFK
ncbi:MAG TPA: bifunctional glycosyltransferase family 2/GtrA family protein [Pseudidiomarina sp.]|nr:bifunctional glycosyltransferase family 2/GtrA family protein [Pseudidiomarina sp.]